ncbi:MAG TPA: hypothetical protein VEZ20_02965 [Allosphingosinicella sp.]|jgi:hypothetical protein|nr:hypothetical protein [Allosphingosinicella sp.]
MRKEGNATIAELETLVGTVTSETIRELSDLEIALVGGGDGDGNGIEAP